MRTIPQKYRPKVPVADLIPHPENPRQGDVGAIYTSIEANGFYGAIVVQKATQHVLRGNHTLQAAVGAGAAAVPVIEIDCDDETALKILLADNRTADLASYDDPALYDLLVRLRAADEEGLAGTGYDDDDLEALRRLNAASATPLPPTGEFPPADPATPTKHVCPECGYEFN